MDTDANESPKPSDIDNMPRASGLDSPGAREVGNQTAAYARRNVSLTSGRISDEHVSEPYSRDFHSQ